MTQDHTAMVSPRPRTAGSRQTTLRLSRPIGPTFALTVLLFGLFLAAGEALARLPAVQSHLATQDWGTNHRQFEFQMDRLRRLAAAEGPPECIALGNSMVWRGLDPATLARAYAEQSGRPLHCFNFGIDGLPAAAAGAVAAILVDDYRPQLLIYGTDARDYAIPKTDDSMTAILDSSWIRYRRGQFSVPGWLVEHSAFYRALEPLGNLLRFDLRRGFRTESRVLHNGFEPDPTIGDFVQQRPVPGSDQPQTSYYFGLLGDYHIRAENLAGLGEILSQKEWGVRVLVVEMPVPPTYLDFFGQGEQDYQRFLDQVSASAAANEAPFLTSTRRLMIPADGWVDYSHLNARGARIFSQWLGGELGGIVAISAPKLSESGLPQMTR